MPQTRAEEKAMETNFSTFSGRQRAMNNSSQQSYIDKNSFASALLRAFGINAPKKTSRDLVIGQLENLVNRESDPSKKIMKIGEALGIEFISNTRTVKP